MAESVAVSWSWQAVGAVTMVDGKLVFPPVPNVAAVYRLTFCDAAGVRTGVYIGEGRHLHTRLQFYRTPGPTQQTNLRLNPIMVDTLRQGGAIQVELITEAWIQTRVVGGEPMLLDLKQKAGRVLVERAAEVIARQGHVPVLNR